MKAKYALFIVNCFVWQTYFSMKLAEEINHSEIISLNNYWPNANLILNWVIRGNSNLLRVYCGRTMWIMYDLKVNSWLHARRVFPRGNEECLNVSVPDTSEQQDAQTRILVWWPNSPQAPVIKPAPIDTRQRTANAQAARSKSDKKKCKT